MSIHTKALIFTKAHEGVKYKSYLDSKGLLSWGIGWCLQTRPASKEERAAIENILGLGKEDIPWDFPVALGRFLDAQTQMHKVTIAAFMHSGEINSLIPQVETRLGYWPDMNDNQQVAIIDLCYNMGIDRWINLFPKTNMLLAQAKYEEASIELLDSDYHRDLVKLRPYPEFILRSERVANMIKTGEWPSDIEEPKD